MPVLLPAKFRYVGCPAANGGASVKLTGSNVSTKHFQFQPEYKGTRRIKVTICDILVQLNENVLGAYMSAFCGVEKVTTVHSVDGMAHDDFDLNISLNRDIPLILIYRDQQVMLVVESRGHSAGPAKT